MKEKKRGWINSNKEFSYFKYSRHALLVQWPKSKSQATLYKILSLENQILNLKIKGLLEIVTGYHSLVIYFEPGKANHAELVQYIEELKTTKANYKKEYPFKTIKVSYDTDHTLDLASVSSELKISVEEIIAIHCRPIYTVHFIGFLPGFLYLGGLDKRLMISRKATPRIRVPAGSVAIAAGQTGIYPVNSPGGWHLIGHTDEELFNPELNPPCPIMPGTKIKFEAV